MNNQTKIDIIYALFIIFNMVMIPVGVLFALAKYNDYEPKR